MDTDCGVENVDLGMDCAVGAGCVADVGCVTDGTTAATAAPHVVQNFAPSRTCAPHFMQNIVFFPSLNNSTRQIRVEGITGDTKVRLQHLGTVGDQQNRFVWFCLLQTS
jgi:hypothetical protein